MISCLIYVIVLSDLNLLLLLLLLLKLPLLMILVVVGIERILALVNPEW